MNDFVIQNWFECGRVSVVAYDALKYKVEEKAVTLRAKQLERCYAVAILLLSFVWLKIHKILRHIFHMYGKYNIQIYM